MNELQKNILNIIQTKYPIVARPFVKIAEQLGVTESEVITAIEDLQQSEQVRRIGAIFSAVHLGYASTLVAAKVPLEQVDAFVSEVNAISGVSHNYGRRHDYNVWFTMTMRSREVIDSELSRLRELFNISEIYSLPAEKLFKIKVDFDMKEPPANQKNETDSPRNFVKPKPVVQPELPAVAGPDTASGETMKPSISPILPKITNSYAIELPAFAGPDSARGETMKLSISHISPKTTNSYAIELLDWHYALIRELQEDIPVISEPFAPIADRLGKSVDDLLAQVHQWKESGVIRRFGASVRHHKIGFAFNGMAVFAVEPDRIEWAGELLAGYKQVSHCYHRPTAPGWPYNLFAMTHSRSEEQLRSVIATMVEKIKPIENSILFTTKEYKKTNVKYFIEDN